MKTTRHPAVAGMFYPDDPVQLREDVAAYLRHGAPHPGLPHALIAPHAGYIYSGPIAGSAYAALAEGRRTVHRVVIIGPSHRVAFRGMAACDAEAFATPLGSVPVDRETMDRLLRHPLVVLMDDAHRDEHGIEVHLPFLQTQLDEFSIVPLVVGEADPESIAEVFDLIDGGPETLIVVSSDLSHYYPYDTAKRMDAATSKAIEELAPDRMDFESACGRLPIQGLLIWAKRHGYHARTLDLRNSGDTAGPRDQVVGYGAYAIH